jgi:hypothetical protein
MVRPLVGMTSHSGASARVVAFWALSCLSCRSSHPSDTPKERAKVATLKMRSGTVDVLRGGSVDWRHLATGEALFEEDRLRTFKGAWAQVAFEGGSTLRMEEESLISLGGVVTVERGSVEGELQGGLRLKTPAMEAEPARDIVIQ